MRRGAAALVVVVVRVETAKLLRLVPLLCARLLILARINRTGRPPVAQTFRPAQHRLQQQQELIILILT